MEVLVTVIGMVVSAILAFPAWELASNDSKKARLAKTLANLDDILLRINRRGLQFLDRLEEYCRPGSQGDPHVLRRLAEQQIDDLRFLKKIFYDSEVELFGKLQRVEHQKPSLKRTLELYGTALDALDSVVDFKSRLLWSFVIYFQSKSEGTDSELPVLVMDQRGNRRLLTPPERYAILKNHALTAEYGATLDLTKPVDLETYFQAAKRRLDELEYMRSRVKKFLTEHFEPHHLR